MNAYPSNNLLYWLALSHLLTIKPAKFKAWLEVMGKLESLFTSTSSDLKEAGFSLREIEKIKTINWSVLEEEQRWYESRSIRVLSFQDPHYPALLKELADPPLVLYVSGDFKLLSAPQLGMVGTRHPSSFGLKTAEGFAGLLVENGLVITSGLAAGIDGVCHSSALAAGGKTIAVMGTGLRQIYPRNHQRLAEKIREQGALISEFPLNTSPLAGNFPRRNRIISGLSLGLLVVEAALGSGSLITARYALEQNREVFAIPGSIHHPQARGCHQLIREGAKLVETVDDIVEELAALTAFVKAKRKLAPPASERLDLDQGQENLLSYIEFGVTAFDELLLRSRLTAAEVSSMLLLLELKGYVEAVQGGYRRCVS